MAIVEENEGLLASAYIYLGTTVSRYSILTYPASLLLYFSPALLLVAYLLVLHYLALLPCHGFLDMCPSCYFCL
jgi:hypothetical protein